MKGSGFSDRAKQLAEWFQDWNSCEQTIALYSLLSKVSATQARFLSLVLEHSLKNACDSQELGRVEKQANNAAYLSSLHSQTEEAALTQLLTHLPLLNPGSPEARKEYMKLLPKVLLGSSEELEYLDKCRQLLSLALVHPVFPHEDREALTYWLAKLDEKHKNIMDRKFYINGRPPARIHQQPSGSVDDMTIRISGWPDAGMHHHEPFALDCEEEKRATFGMGQTSHFFSTTNGHEPYLKSSSLPGHSLVHSAPVVEWKGGMKDVPMWLKSLRLHKYLSLFADLSYEEMLQISDEYLERKKVTKGAKNKILLNIHKLVRRPETLAQLEQEMEKHGRLLECINDLKLISQTPIKPFHPPELPPRELLPKAKEGGRESGGEEEEEDSACSSPSSSSSPGLVRSCSVGSDLDELLTHDYPSEDLPSLLTRAYGKAYNQLMLHTETNEENLLAFISLMDTALGHEAHTTHQKQLFLEWQQQCQQVYKVLTKKVFRSWFPGSSNTYHGTTSQSPSRLRGRSLRAGTKNGGQAKGMTLPNLSRSSSTLPRMSVPRQLQQPHGLVSAVNKPFLPSPGPHLAPVVQPQPPPIPPKSTELNDTLYDLCKRVTEQALDDLSDN